MIFFKIKELIVIVVVYIIGCLYCIEVYVVKYKKLGGIMDEILEVVIVVVVFKVGVVISYSVNVINVFERE